MQLAVLGSPIAHSKSPAIHNAAYHELGLDWSYGRIECDEGGFSDLLNSFDSSWRGLSLTMPLKEVACATATTLDEWAQKSGAVNTLLHDGQSWHGFNTDVPGLALALEEDEVDVTQTVIFGAGATAVSALLAAKLRGAEKITVLARREEAARALAERHNVDHATFDTALEGAMRAATAVISTLPGEAGAGIHNLKNFLQAHLFDVAYDPWPSPLTRIWQANSGRTSHGVNMLINQALYQIRIFVGGDTQKKLPNEAHLLQTMRAASEV